MRSNAVISAGIKPRTGAWLVGRRLWDDCCCCSTGSPRCVNARCMHSQNIPIYSRGCWRLTLRFELATGNVNGEIVVDAGSGQSGSDSRDKKMHKEVLESSRFTEIIFRPERVEGTVQPQGTSSTHLHGVCVLHGSEHEITVPVRAGLKSDQWKGTATFSVPYNEWGLKNPGNFLLKVDHTVSIEVEMAGRVQTQASAGKP